MDTRVLVTDRAAKAPHIQSLALAPMPAGVESLMLAPAQWVPRPTDFDTHALKAHADAIHRLRDALALGFGDHWERSPVRIAKLVEDGTSILANLLSEPEFSEVDIQACHSLAEQDPRLGFIHRLPRSAGYGAAIGDAVTLAFFGRKNAATRTITSLLNIFMTVLDGLVDEAPEMLEARLNPLLGLLWSGTSGEDVTRIRTLEDRSFGAACFSIARLWLRKVQSLDSATTGLGPRTEFAQAARHAMLSELATCEALLAKGVPVCADALYGRTRWPLWTQAVACAVPYGWPLRTDRETFRELIFDIADFVTYLDDMCDFIIDCDAGRWNTVFWEIHRLRPLASLEPDALRRRLLVSLTDDDLMDAMIEHGQDLLTKIEQSSEFLEIPCDGLKALLSDLTYDYLRRRSGQCDPHRFIAHASW